MKTKFLPLGLLLLTISLSTQAFAGSLSERFPSENNYPQGTLVSFLNTTPSSVDLADINSSDYLVGVVENEGNSLLSITRDNGSIDVAITGEVEAFVSDVNGPIKEGDFVGTSWIRGVAMKASNKTEQKLLGIALESFNEDSFDFIEVPDIETPDGKKTVKLGKLAIRLFDREIGPEANASEKTFIETFAARVAGRDVAFARVLGAVSLFAVSAIVSGFFIANAIRGSFISLGRNPLASASIYTNLVQVTVVAMGVIVIGTVLAYVILTL